MQYIHPAPYTFSSIERIPTKQEQQGHDKWKNLFLFLSYSEWTRTVIWRGHIVEKLQKIHSCSS